MSEEEPIGMMTTEQCWDMLRTAEGSGRSFELSRPWLHMVPQHWGLHRPRAASA